MFTKKSLVLLGINSQQEKAVLTLESQGELVSGRLRLYNFGKEPEGIVSLGFYQNGKVKKCGLVRSSNMLYTFKTDAFDAEEFSCAVVNFVGAKVTPLLFGTTQKNTSNEEILGKIAGEVFDESEAKKIEQKLDEHAVQYDDELQAEIDQQIDKAFSQSQPDEDKCSNCKYKRCFFGEEESQQKVFFIDEIKGQIDKLFKENPKENFLEEAIPSSKWVRVEFDGEGDYYILGLVYDEAGAIKYVCYGVPGIYQKNPPKQLSGYPVWFPLDSQKKESFGYWLTYQDAETGESIKAVVE